MGCFASSQSQKNKKNQENNTESVSQIEQQPKQQNVKAVSHQQVEIKFEENKEGSTLQKNQLLKQEQNIQQQANSNHLNGLTIQNEKQEAENEQKKTLTQAIKLQHDVQQTNDTITNKNQLEQQGDTIQNDAKKNQQAEENNRILTNDFAQQFYHINNLHNEIPAWKFFKTLLINHFETQENITQRKQSINKALDDIPEMENYTKKQKIKFEVKDANLLFEKYICNQQWVQNLQRLPLDKIQVLHLKVIEEVQSQLKRFINKGDSYQIDQNGLKNSQNQKNGTYVGRSGDIRLHPQDSCDEHQLEIRYSQGNYYFIDYGSKFLTLIKITQQKPLVLRKGLLLQIGTQNICQVKDLYPEPDIKDIDIKQNLFIEFENEQSHKQNAQSNNQTPFLMIQFLEGELKQQSANIPQETECTIGRSQKNQLRFTDQEVSSNHAKMFYDQNKWIFMDNSSSNGSWVVVKDTYEKCKRGVVSDPFKIQNEMQFKVGEGTIFEASLRNANQKY